MFWNLDVLGLDVLGLDVLILDVLGLDVLILDVLGYHRQPVVTFFGNCSNLVELGFT
jgi:hypothetical protein